MTKFSINEIVYKDSIKGMIEHKFTSYTGDLKYVFRRLNSQDYSVCNADQLSRTKINPKLDETNVND